MNTQEFFAEQPDRLDIFLASKLQQTRSQIVQLIKNGGVSLEDQVITKPGVKLKAGQRILVTPPQPKETQPQEIDFDIEILFEDDDLLVINKPSGIITHPAPSVSEPTLVDWLKHKGIRLSTLSGEERHGIVHRLDKGTSGVMVVAKNNQTHEALSLQLQDKSMGRYYLAVSIPPLKNDITVVEKPIRRSQHNRLKMGCDPSGKYAKTEFKKTALSTDEKYDLLTCKLFTGRTHQIRVHLETLSRHILGDPLYGNKNDKNEPQRILLHAYMLYFVHPKTKQREYFTASLDETFNSFLKQNFNMEEIYEKIQRNTIELGFSSTV